MWFPKPITFFVAKPCEAKIRKKVLAFIDLVILLIDNKLMQNEGIWRTFRRINLHSSLAPMEAIYAFSGQVNQYKMWRMFHGIR